MSKTTRLNRITRRMVTTEGLGMRRFIRAIDKIERRTKSKHSFMRLKRVRKGPWGKGKWVWESTAGSGLIHKGRKP